MAQSLSKVLLHLVFSTKNRKDSIPPELAPELHAYLAGACRGQGSEAFRVGGTTDHVHIACTLPRTMSVSKLLEEIKKSSSKWMKTTEGGSKSFSWQSGYAAFSLGASRLDELTRYIDRQVEHHKKRSFRQELVDFLEKYGVEYDERYLWD